MHIHHQGIRTKDVLLFGEQHFQDFEARSPHTSTGSDLDKAPGRAGSSGKADLRGKRNAFTMSRGQFMEQPWGHELIRALSKRADKQISEDASVVNSAKENLVSVL